MVQCRRSRNDFGEYSFFLDARHPLALRPCLRASRRPFFPSNPPHSDATSRCTFPPHCQTIHPYPAQALPSSREIVPSSTLRAPLPAPPPPSGSYRYPAVAAAPPRGPSAPPPAPPPPRCPSPDARDLSRTPTDRQAQTAGGLAVWLPGNAALPASMPASMREGASSQPAAISGSAIAQIPRRIPGRRREIVSRVSGAGVGLTFGGATRALHLPAALPSPVH